MSEASPHDPSSAEAPSQQASCHQDGCFPPGLPHVSHTDLHHPADLYAAFDRAVPIAFCRSLVPDQHCLHRVGYAQIGQVLLVSHTGTPAEFLVEHTPHFHLVSCFEGNLALKAAGGSIQLSRNGAALLPSGLRHANGSCSLAGLTLPPAAVAAAAAAIAGPSRPATCPPEGVYQPVSLSSGPRLEMIHGLLNTIDSCLAAGPWAATHLGLDDVVVRIAATLLQPALLEEDPPDLLRYRGREGKSSFDELIDYIRNNLDQPLRLSDLESRSHYSRRALQYAFRQRLHSTPKQWIREQRLSLAMKHLQGQEVRPTVQEVALLCGYVRVSHFSKDFKERFGLSPSEARRL